jgi:preprotein translocase subunit SecD
MMYFSRLKTALIFGACLLGVLLCIPNVVRAPANWLPWRQVHLGLDLQGGSYLLMQVDMQAVVRERLNGIADAARAAMRQPAIGYQNLTAQPAQNRVTMRLRDPARTNEAVGLLRNAVGTQDANGVQEVDVASSPDGEITMTLTDASMRDRASSAVQQSIEIVRRRIDDTGVVDPQIARQGNDRIVVQLPGVSDPQHIKDLLGQTAKMTFRLLDDTANVQSPVPPPGVDFLPMTDNPTQKLAVRQKVEVDGADLTDARPAPNQQRGGWVVTFRLNSVGARRFADVTSANVGRPFAIVLDNKVISAPVINEPITAGSGEISGNFNLQRANDLAVLLRAGALPAPLTVVEERSVGPELGADSIRAGALALAVGFLLVIAYMAIFYGLFGWIANLALLINLLLMLALLSLLQATLTLPGMAGMLLTLGMAVDANILINERIREEAKNGRAPFAAMEAGFKRAYSTILDSNITALLAHVMLFVFGTGPVRGFAVTITVGIVTSLFTAFMLARLLMVRWYVSNRPAALPV